MKQLSDIQFLKYLSLYIHWSSIFKILSNFPSDLSDPCGPLEGKKRWDWRCSNSTPCRGSRQSRDCTMVKLSNIGAAISIQSHSGDQFVAYLSIYVYIYIHIHIVYIRRYLINITINYNYIILYNMI